MTLRETGTVVEAGDGRARVRVSFSHECGKCGRCLMPARGESTVIEVVDCLGCRPGDRVELEMESRQLVKVAAVLYLVPLALAALGYLAGRWLVGGDARAAELGGVAGGALSFAISFGLLRRFDVRAKATGNYLPAVVRIVESEERG
jgi:sigma-E factor negative regulatory protein RseC